MGNHDPCPVYITTMLIASDDLDDGIAKGVLGKSGGPTTGCHGFDGLAVMLVGIMLERLMVASTCRIRVAS